MVTTNSRRGANRVSQRQPSAGQRLPAALDLDSASQQAVSPWLTTHEACDYLRYRGKHRLRSLYKFIERTGVNVSRRSGRSLLLKRSDLDAAIGAK